jgi:DNA-binding CsgD family transcriptional regulator
MPASVSSADMARWGQVPPSKPLHYPAKDWLPRPCAAKLPKFLLDQKAFQASFSMAVRAVAYRNPERTNKQEVELADLTMREQTILALLAQDKTNQEIAAELSISLSTAKADVSKILRKLKVESRKQAGIKARYSGLAYTKIVSDFAIRRFCPGPSFYSTTGDLSLLGHEAE